MLFKYCKGNSRRIKNEPRFSHILFLLASYKGKREASAVQFVGLLQYPEIFVFFCVFKRLGPVKKR